MHTVRKVADFDPDMPEYEVVVGGQVVGTVYKAWFRLGGAQWTHRSTAIGPAGATRQGAIQHLLSSLEVSR